MVAGGAGARGEGTAPCPSPEIAAEAAVWIARLHGPDRSPQMERECLDWQARSAAHRLAFERCTDVWEAVPRVRLADAYASAAQCEPAIGQGNASGDCDAASSRIDPLWLLMSLALVFVLGSGFALLHWRDGDVYATKVGERQSLVLDDGSRMSLNTTTRVRVEIRADRRTVEVLEGEALFEVAKDPGRRPFVVRAAGSEVVALGTVFAVRVGGAGGSGGAVEALAIMLLEGQVAVRPGLVGRVAAVNELVMHPGERLRLAGSGRTADSGVSARVDRPRLDEVMAWTRSELVFDDLSLREAVDEMNRYNRTPIVLGDASLARLRVSGLYRAGDSRSFAQAVATLHGLVVREGGGRLELLTPQ